ncbi:MAG: ATP-dependent DNA ligase [Candidatus Proteinoplasmatales archaeon SG8-5]|nr:MAG: ATP-dependent DNA ligase [Candidatus Proteinoplasmatales archaeon SG8-5]
MDYMTLAKAYESIGATSKRLEMTDLLVELLLKTPKNEVEMVVYLTQGKVAPDFKGIELGLAEKLALKAIYEGTRVDEAKINEWWIKDGDLGSVAFQAVSEKKQTSLFTESLNVTTVFDSLLNIAKASGSGSQELKMKLFAKLLHDSSPVEAKYIARTMAGKLRLGIADMTIVDALAVTYAGKEDRDAVERAYNTCSDLGRVAGLLATKGLGGLSEVKLEVGVPLRAMLCERLTSIGEIIGKLGGECAFEYKYDGLRIQAHIRDGHIDLFTRQLEKVTDQFPDIVNMLAGAFKGKEGVVEGECVPVDVNTGEMLPFQTVSRRRGRKFELTSAVNEFPVMLYLFDCLFLDDRDLTHTPYPNRRAELAACISETERVKVSESMTTGDAADAEGFFDQAIERGAEGIIAKSVADDSFYRAGSRGWQWIKFKRDYRSEMSDTVDLVAVGGFAGRGRRAGAYGALLMATYNREEDRFETVTKLGSGFDDDMLAALPGLLDDHRLDKADRRVCSEMKPDHWFAPSLVLEVRGAEITLSPIHTCGFGVVREGAGLAIRFPRYTGRIREDKAPEDATSTDEVLAMYNLQLKKLS